MIITSLEKTLFLISLFMPTWWRWFCLSYHQSNFTVKVFVNFHLSFLNIWLNFFNSDPPVVIFKAKIIKWKNGFLVISRSLFWDLVWMWDLRLRTWRSIRRFSHPIHPRLKLERGHITHAAEHYVAPYPNSGWHYKWIISRNWDSSKTQSKGTFLSVY